MTQILSLGLLLSVSTVALAGGGHDRNHRDGYHDGQHRHASHNVRYNNHHRKIQSTTAMAIDITRKIITMPVAIHITVVIATIGIHAVM